MQYTFPGARLASTLVFVFIASLMTACNSEEDIGDAGAVSGTGTGATTSVTDATTTEPDTTTPDTDSATIPTSVVTWVAPAAREDNSPISMAEIAGYRIYYGEIQGEYQNQYEVDDAYDNDLDPTELGLSSGVYYLVITTVDTDGRESNFSEEVTVNI